MNKESKKIIRQRRKRNASLAVKAAKLTGDSHYIDDHPEFFASDEDSDVNRRYLNEEQAKEGEPSTQTQNTGYDNEASYGKGQNLKKQLEHDKENLKTKEKEKIRERSKDIEADVDDLEEELDADGKPKKKKRFRVISNKVNKRLEMIARIAMHAIRAPGDQAGKFDEKQINAERARQKNAGQSDRMELKYDGRLHALTDEVGVAAKKPKELIQEAKQSELGALCPDALHNKFSNKDKEQDSPGMGR